MKTQLKENEELVLIIRKHWFVLLKPILITLVLLIPPYFAYKTDFEYYSYALAGLSLLWFAFKVIDRRNNLWAVTNLRIVDEYGVFSNNSKETPLDKINNVVFQQPFWGRIFNYGHVQIQSAAELGSTSIIMVESPEKLKDAITEHQELYKQEQLKEQARNLANAVGEPKSSSQIDFYEELLKLNDLKEKGIITEEDFQKLKEKIVSS